MIYPEQSKFSYVGSRSYIRGADLYAYFLEGFEAMGLALPAPVMVSAFKLVNEVKADGRWHILDQDGTLPEDVTPSATLDYVDSSGKTQEAVFIEDGAIITKKSPDIPSRLERLEPDYLFGGQATLKVLESKSTFLDGLIEANKAFHVATLKERNQPVDSIRFVYIEDMPIDPPMAEMLFFENKGEHKRGGHVFTLNAIRPAQSPTMSHPPTKICYCF